LNTSFCKRTAGTGGIGEKHRVSRGAKKKSHKERKKGGGYFISFDQWQAHKRDLQWNTWSEKRGRGRGTKGQGD